MREVRRSMAERSMDEAQSQRRVQSRAEPVRLHLGQCHREEKGKWQPRSLSWAASGQTA